MPLSLKQAEEIRDKLREKYDADLYKMDIDVAPPLKDKPGAGYGIQVSAHGDTPISHAHVIFDDACAMAGETIPKSFICLGDEQVTEIRDKKIVKDIAAGTKDKVKPMRPLKLKKSPRR
jgi:hypothetical protein